MPLFGFIEEVVDSFMLKFTVELKLENISIRRKPLKLKELIKIRNL